MGPELGWEHLCFNVSIGDKHNDNLYFQRVFLSKIKVFYRFDLIIPPQHPWHLEESRGQSSEFYGGGSKNTIITFCLGKIKHKNVH